MRALCLGLLISFAAGAADKWNIAHQLDEDDTSLEIRKIAFSSQRRGIAVGVLTVKTERRPVAIVTSDGGKTWEQVKLREEPISITCIVEEICWISTVRGVWRSEEGGLEWKKISGERGIISMQFQSPTRGFAAGVEKNAWETDDGGKNWKEIPAAKKINATAANAQFTSVAVHGMVGIIGGNSRPPRRPTTPYPDWMDPEEASKRREWPGMLMMLETRDGGKTWVSSTNSAFGTLTAVRIRPEGTSAIALLEYFNTFESPAELLLVDFKTGRSSSILRSKDYSITDVTAGENGHVVAGGVEAAALRAVPIPQKVRFLEVRLDSARTTMDWKQIAVDYRVTARRVTLSQAPGGTLWAATDTGFILRLDRDAARKN